MVPTRDFIPVQDQVSVQNKAVDETNAEAAPVMEDEPKYILLCLSTWLPLKTFIFVRKQQEQD